MNATVEDVASEQSVLQATLQEQPMSSGSTSIVHPSTPATTQTTPVHPSTPATTQITPVHPSTPATTQTTPVQHLIEWKKDVRPTKISRGNEEPVETFEDEEVDSPEELTPNNDGQQESASSEAMPDYASADTDWNIFAHNDVVEAKTRLYLNRLPANISWRKTPGENDVCAIYTIAELVVEAISENQKQPDSIQIISDCPIERLQSVQQIVEDIQEKILKPEVLREAQNEFFGYCDEEVLGDMSFFTVMTLSTILHIMFKRLDLGGFECAVYTYDHGTEAWGEVQEIAKSGDGKHFLAIRNSSAHYEPGLQNLYHTDQSLDCRPLVITEYLRKYDPRFNGGIVIHHTCESRMTAGVESMGRAFTHIPEPPSDSLEELNFNDHNTYNARKRGAGGSPPDQGSSKGRRISKPGDAEKFPNFNHTPSSYLQTAIIDERDLIGDADLWLTLGEQVRERSLNMTLCVGKIYLPIGRMPGLCVLESRTLPDAAEDARAMALARFFRNTFVTSNAEDCKVFFRIVHCFERKFREVVPWMERITDVHIEPEDSSIHPLSYYVKLLAAVSPWFPRALVWILIPTGTTRQLKDGSLSQKGTGTITWELTLNPEVTFDYHDMPHGLK